MRIFADTNVLFPFSVMDLLLALTENEVHELVWSDFPAGPLAALGLRVATPDEYLCELFESAPAEVVATIDRLAEEKRNPPMTPDDLLARVGKTAPAFADKARRHFS
ncbi:MAG: hypothetical protein HOV87_34595 [Catenulispora sp.]|nr:hypothetical protein [Catenulispora sp.]